MIENQNSLYIDSKNIVALSASDHKQAAFFFDQIIPLHTFSSVPREVIAKYKFDRHKTGRVFQDIVNAEPVDQKQVATKLTNIYFSEYGHTLYLNSSNAPRSTLEIYTDLVDQWSNPEMLATIALNYAKIEENRILVPTLESNKEKEYFTAQGTDKLIELSISNLCLVDTRNLAWDQILEFRKDEESKKAFRNLKLFFFANYKGKTEGFIRDDIQRQLDQYEEVCKKHGISLIVSSLSVLLNSKSFLATLGLGTMSALIGIPLASITPALLADAFLEVGKIGINVAEKYKDLSQYKKEHPLAYIVRIPKSN